MAERTVIDVAKDFSRFLAGRYASDGSSSAENFRERIVIPALRRGGIVAFDVDGVVGMPSSFIEEAFGGLIRNAISNGLEPNDIMNRVEIISKRVPAFAVEVRYFMEAATKELNL